MPRRHLKVTAAVDAPLRTALRGLRVELAVPETFPAAVLDEAEQVALAPRLPDRDATDLPLFSIDPAASQDLDQAMHLSRRPGGGFRVRYAIADVAAFVTPGLALDTEAHRRITTLYFPDRRVPLHPALIGESAASLLPGQARPAVLWTLDLDADGRTVSTDLRRALVRNRTRLDYASAQRHIDAGTAEEPLALLRTVGTLRERLEAERGGISLNVPEQQIIETPAHGPAAGTYALTYRAPLPTDRWNAQISLLTGMAAAELMITRGTGVLRTLPAAPDGAVGRLRRTAKALGIDWPHHVPYAELVRSLDPRQSRHAAFLQECTTLLRGAGYTVFSGGKVPEFLLHAAVAAPYTHCTAPLRRLVDRYTSEVCVAAVAGREPPEWVLADLDALPAKMAEGTRRAATVERECLDIVEAALLMDRIGEVFDACVVDVKEHEPTVGTVQLTDPAVVARIEGGTEPLPLGERLRVRLRQADPGRAKALFTPA
ncbi:RNB domain-containing ribonuclease [Streptomyces sp. PSKA54]|uniref:RNB domain-containing ribonuclease n=1 Tax=Streptomyces himalayensis subsp. aureolus TaxID=2758039 RepID=A0A7W2D4X7_9ACTN|nr:RNB domain-containing ribonuclease [Streptomyces himalayensis]MBA4864803.1 RNB domain-containing ribonuclease [Streptomyces himalayensis subsp. aureolus]